MSGIGTLLPIITSGATADIGIEADMAARVPQRPLMTQPTSAVSRRGR